ncbi:MAG TPA: hypothetical protein V6D47_02845 [Oscillatoriaceae cyanobacterium]
MSTTAPSLWFHSRRYDLVWYAAVPALLMAALFALSHALGPKGPIIAYMASATLTGLPHNWITWLLILPEKSRAYYGRGTLFVPFVATAIALIPTVLLFGTPLFAWALTLNISLAYYHITRQHQGLLHSCDGRYIQATGDTGVRPYSRDLRWLVGAFAAVCLAWKATGGPMQLGLGIKPMTFTLAPVPIALPLVLSAVCAFLAGRFAWNTWRRARAGKPFAKGHALIGGVAIAILGLAALVPNDQFYLTLAMVACTHNMQYFAFCYTHHHLRATADPVPNDTFTRWARARRWAPWFLVPIGLGVAFAGVCALLPPALYAFALNWFMTSHYFVDANIWRRKYYPTMGRFASGRVEPVPVGA